MKPWQLFLLGGLFGLLATGIILLVALEPRGTPVLLIAPPTPGPAVVYINGSIQKPGVYSLPDKSRIEDAVKVAGGFSSDADPGSVNLAAPIRDGQQIQVRAKGEVNLSPISQPAQNLPKNGTATVNFPIDINSATSEELQELPDIGKVTADAIIAYRTQVGRFKVIDDIQKVKGIGPKTFAKIKDMITCIE